MGKRGEQGFQRGNMRVLCVCNHGNVRSVALARAIKDISLNTENQPHEAIAIGAMITSLSTLMLLEHWADKIVWMSEKVRVEFRGNSDVINVIPSMREKMVNKTNEVGIDRWNNPFHPELQEMMKKMAVEILK